MPVLFAVWGSGAWVVTQFFTGHLVFAALAFAVWFLAVTALFLLLHRRGFVRLAVSAGATLFVLLIVGAFSW